MFIYVVLENGDLYSSAFTSYKMAIEAVQFKHNEKVPGMNSANELNVTESPTGVTLLYVEKGICIEIYRLQLCIRIKLIVDENCKQNESRRCDNPS